MAEDDLDLAALADYLHLGAAQVQRMVERGQIPGRRVGGDWRFAPREIHHWLEERIGALDESQLGQLEGALRRSSGTEAGEAVRIADLLSPELIAIPLEARTRSSVFTAMAELAASTGLLWDQAKMAEAIRAREEMYPTALENGVALLHPRRPLPSILAQPLLAFGRTSQGIGFGGPRGTLTDLFFLIASDTDQGHLRTLARLSRLLTDAAFLAELRTAERPGDAYQLFVSREAALTD